MIYSKEEKAKWITKWQKSGKKTWTYAKENGLTPQTLMYWIKSEEKQKRGFVEIHQPLHYQVQEILVEKGDVKIHIPLGLNSCELQTIMKGFGVAL